MDATPLSDAESSFSAPVDSPVVSFPQPTYTTAGTIYKPSSSQPLQPPTRRGRLSKWSAGGISSDLALFPKSVLAGLSMKTPAGRPNSALQLYTPLQQNNHRAVSPFSEPDHLLARMPMETPRLRSGNTPRDLSAPLSEEAVQDKPVTEEGEHRCADASDDDSEGSEAKITLLSNMPVKSLHNLASYQNPSQKYAQRALLRGRRSRPLGMGSSYTGSTTSTSPPPLMPGFNPPYSSSEVGGPSNLALQEQTDLLAFRRARLDASRMESWTSRRNGTSTPTFSNTPRNRAVSELPNLVATSSASASGALLPLTAGPPGQRQYRPLAVESTINASATAGPSSPPPYNPADDDTLQIANRVLVEAGIEDVCIESLGSLFAENSNSASSYLTSQGAGGHTEQLRPVLPGATGYDEEMQLQFRDIVGPLERMKVWDPNEKLIQTKSWRDPSPEVRALYKPGTDRFTDEAMAAHNDKVEECWLSGVNNRRERMRPQSTLSESALLFESTPLPRSRPEAYQDFGVIGDRRLKTPISPSEKASVEETTEVPASEHAASLLELAKHTQSQNGDGPATDSAMH
ncbi:uncharacterized protein MAM_03253 [Metarhizium album ARSEF 1941]|uniref:Uncharacterized protein n=1 Tax=Metarhizium album (strain ARSEF 1941) TaxID=1081103 RepID=A0A0B2WRW2_METAS|nr:uncharacterized protein MAM_03253 [Metarhizium album ARSEF 1941]KHN98791.1 hypothetical protein MAM_03253 [Metarhizium album ARSEF 1941]